MHIKIYRNTQSGARQEIFYAAKSEKILILPGMKYSPQSQPLAYR